MAFLIHQLLERSADRDPDHPALRSLDEAVSYSELVARSNRLGHALVAHGVRLHDRVGIYAFKGPEAVVAVYGTLLAGAAYVPLDPSAPPARLASIIRDCGVSVVVSQDRMRPGLADLQAAGAEIECVIGVDDAVPNATTISWADVGTGPDTSPPCTRCTELDPAYIIYTSGTTGPPKGITHTHRSCLSFVDWAAEEYGLVPEDRLANHAPLHFDLSTFDFFAGASAGATTVVIPEAHTRLPASLSQLMADERISVSYTVPAALVQLSLRGALEERDMDALRWVIYGGEAFPTPRLRTLMAQLPRARFSQLYGVTETNVCTWYHVPRPLPPGDAPIPIGRVLPNMDPLVVDEEDRPVAAEAIGELLIRGPATMTGYWGRPDLDASAFLRVERAPGFEGVYYRTGDLVHRLPSGDLQFVGRKDRQIKTRGFRVELEEIEHALLAHAAVHEAAAFVVPDGEGSQRIRAAVVGREGLTESDLLDHLRARIPDYAVPARLDLVNALPRTSAGKIDHNALAATREPSGTGP